MIKPEELRPGNLVYAKRRLGAGFESKTADNVTTVWTILLDGINGDGFSGHDTHFDDLEPIPLTEDWLIKFGINKDSQLIGGVHYEFLEAEGVHGYELLPNEWPVSIVELNFVHELQNWYYWNSGKIELTIKQ